MHVFTHLKKKSEGKTGLGVYPLMGLPVPGIFLYKEPVINRHLVVDGQQRLRTCGVAWERDQGELG
jgi:hypothetical protein